MQAVKKQQNNFTSHQFIVQNPSQKHGDSKMIALKRIQNYSYCLADEIGLGLTSHVYKGKNDLTGLTVAIKMIDLKNHQDSLNQQLIKEEISVLEKIKQMKNARHLLRLEAVIKTNNNLYIITEFCEGKDMAKTLRQKKVLSEEQAQSTMKQMIAGYGELYSLGIIHRDLKLSNLFIANGQIKLADFGFATSEDKCNSNLTYNVGSPKYMAPQCLKFNKYSFKGDVWSMGIIAYEMVYGQPPWSEKNDAKLFDMITSIPVQNLFDPNVPVSNSYKTFIVNCLQPDLRKRAGADFIFNYPWPLADLYVKGFEQEVKVPEVVKIPGNNYAVYNSAKQISYQSKKLDVDDFLNDGSIPTQSAALSQLNYCRFLIKIYSSLKSMSNPNYRALQQELAMTIQLKMKILGEMAITSQNVLKTADFNSYINSADWENLKQVIIRYDIEFRKILKGEQLPRSNATIEAKVLPRTISYMKSELPENWRILDQLISYLQIRQIAANTTPLEFSQRVNIAAAVKDTTIPDQQFDVEGMLNRIEQRIEKWSL